VGQLKSLQRCCLVITNINAFVMIYKNWPSDARIGCSFLTFSLKDFYYAKEKLLDDHEERIMGV